MGGAESFLHNRCRGSKSSARCGGRHSDNFSTGISSTPSYAGFKSAKADFHENDMFSVSPSVDNKADENSVEALLLERAVGAKSRNRHLKEKAHTGAPTGPLYR
jgi:hypothetical protein